MMKLRGKKVVCLLMTLILSCMFCCASVSAAEVDVQENLIVARATGSFNMSLSGHTLKKASTSFPLESGEVVTIKASYSPFSANMDFGLIGPDGAFHYVSVSSGTISQKIKISTAGNYTFAVRNNSSQTVKVSGFVNY